MKHFNFLIIKTYSTTELPDFVNTQIRLYGWDATGNHLDQTLNHMEIGYYDHP